ncbi:metallophosphoesterase family protein [Desulfofalx alkaliphila]|uniref:metallophosphoesterase family protein n=1 Tax=Desulfofalx alkaliphila TaxID=105483 RepID=UPI0004E111C4|nr:metallophosphoesterase [Desulfofalx alkaliphila]
MNTKVKRFLIIIALAAFISLAFLHFFGGTQITVEGLEFQIDTSLAYRGSTQLVIPPLGSIRAYTHDTPVRLTVTLTNINLERVQQLLETAPDQEEIFQHLEEDLRQRAKRYVISLIIMSGLAALLAGLVLRSTNIFEYMAALLAAMALVGSLLGATYKDYNYHHFSNPEYEGALKTAPWMISIAENTLAKIDTLGHKLQLIAQNFNELYQQIDHLQPLQTAQGNIKVLHVSDIHNNPAAIEYIDRMAQLFAVNFIIDTGDISDFGTPLEGLLLDRIANLGVPYVFVAGNHDSPDIINKMNSLGPNVIVSDGPVEISGLRIMGYHDPASVTAHLTPPAPGEVEGYIEEIRQRVAEEVKSSGRPIDIIAVHSPYMARPLAGLAPVFVFGHNHQYEVTTDKGSVMVNAGSSGASGLATLQETQRRPYSVMMLHFFKDNSETYLVGVDAIQVDSITAEFSMQRHLFDHMDLKSLNFKTRQNPEEAEEPNDGLLPLEREGGD